MPGLLLSKNGPGGECLVTCVQYIGTYRGCPNCVGKFTGGGGGSDDCGG